jgi:hypothetical protein
MFNMSIVQLRSARSADEIGHRLMGRYVVISMDSSLI